VALGDSNGGGTNNQQSTKSTETATMTAMTMTMGTKGMAVGSQGALTLVRSIHVDGRGGGGLEVGSFRSDVFVACTWNFFWHAHG
jgi:hypothetical protein